MLACLIRKASGTALERESVCTHTWQATQYARLADCIGASLARQHGIANGTVLPG